MRVSVRLQDIRKIRGFVAYRSISSLTLLEVGNHATSAIKATGNVISDFFDLL